jgi:predicted metal-binding protein
MLKNYFHILSKEINKTSIVFTKKTQQWCALPYNNNKHCPNYNSNPLCPPNSPYLETKINSYTYFYLFYALFNFKRYKDAKRLIHPDWSEKQLGNSRHWQSSIKSKLYIKIKEVTLINNIQSKDIYLLFCGAGINKKEFINNDVVYSMEAIGIYVLSTLKNNNIQFELKPVNKILLVSLLCSNKQLILEEEEIQELI